MPQRIIPPDVRLLENQSHYSVHKCSGHPSWHYPDCDKNCGYERITEADVKIRNELNNWHRLEVEPSMVPHNIFNMDAQLTTVIQVLLEMLHIDEDEFNARYREVLLNKLVAVREQNEEQFKRMKTLQGISIPGQGPNIIGPNGTPLQ